MATDPFSSLGKSVAERRVVLVLVMVHGQLSDSHARLLKGGHQIHMFKNNLASQKRRTTFH